MKAGTHGPRSGLFAPFNLSELSLLSTVVDLIAIAASLLGSPPYDTEALLSATDGDSAQP